MTREEADVIIVGAGPAGAATALLLARAGVDVLLLDRAVFPRAKPCGDCLSIGATAVLARLGVLDAVLAAPHARLGGWHIIAPSGAAFSSAFSRGGEGGRDMGVPHAPVAGAISIERSVLDAVLVRAAIAAGARLERDAVTDITRDAHGHVTGVRTRTRTHAALLTVGADGLRSIVARRLGARHGAGRLRKLSLTFHVPVTGALDTGEMHVGDGLCAGVAPIAANCNCNVTVVADAQRFGRAVADDAVTFAADAIDTLPRLRGRIPVDALQTTRPLASGPFDQPVSNVAFNGAVLIGDAAGYYDPFTGQGVFQALASAELLAPVIIDCVARHDMRAQAFAPYVAARASIVNKARLVQRGIECVLRWPALANRAIARIDRAPAFAQAIIDVTGDIAPARLLATPRVLASLFPLHPPENAA